ncbi:unnamed protein product [Euphydryas editha]|uniref:Uncharacterized protein n=1 Tax=Euphydryas editha TaxID=104508 RepID=A0AAU9TXU5_EUPED|nr:unnamed protein product [Euphydryas editha]
MSLTRTPRSLSPFNGMNRLDTRTDRPAQLAIAFVTGSSYIYVKFKAHHSLQVKLSHKQHELSPVTISYLVEDIDKCLVIQ